MKMNKDLFKVGSRFGRLVVIGSYNKNDSRHKFYKCLCDCGNIRIVQDSHLKTGNTKSCGCYRKEDASKKFTKHNKSADKLYGVWQTMKQRCYNKNNKSYNNYGGRGIIVYSEWKNEFMNFYNWAINNGYDSGLTLDRINVNGNYEPNNCRWVNQLNQQNNRRNNRFITYLGETKTLCQWSRVLNIPSFTLRKRLYDLNWSIEKAFNTPVRKGRQQ